jgi:tryptophan-rich sensory protein
MKWNKKILIICLAIPIFTGLVSSFLTKNYITIYQEIHQPPLAPPGWIFPLVWSILYLLMGISSYLINTSSVPSDQIQKANIVYGIQLILNFFWPIWFFCFEYFFLSFIWLVILWYFIFLTIQHYLGISKPAAYLMIPYLLWVTFAGYLNLGILFLN